MALISTRCCPACGTLNVREQSSCLWCREPLPPEASIRPADPMTTETCNLYRATVSDAMLLFSNSALEYSAAGMSFVTEWNNVASLTHSADDDQIWLYHTPQRLTLPLGSSQLWFANSTRTIPLRQFGYPANRDLSRDLARYAPQLRRYGI